MFGLSTLIIIFQTISKKEQLIIFLNKNIFFNFFTNPLLSH